MGIVPLLENVTSDKEVIKYLTGVEDIVIEDWVSEPFRPGYYLCVDGETGSVILAFRGTANLHDGLVDLSCTPCDFLNGKAHSGFVNSAAKLASKLKPIVDNTLEMHPGFKLVLTGHSLGAAMASMLALDWIDQYQDLQCYAFAAPCVASLEVALLHSDQIFSFVHGSDMVSRWSLQTTKSLSQSLEIVHQHGSAKVLSQFLQCQQEGKEEEIVAAKSELRELWNTVQKSHDASDYFFPAGKLIRIDPKFPSTRSGFMAHSDLGGILLVPEALSAHLPNGMLKSFEKINC
jgi:sn1-specific diacylglycerol lipase